nr:putative transposase [Ipomoea batatas]
MPFFNNHVDGPLIILLQLCRAKVVDSEVRISSSYTATKVLFNLDCQEFTDFRNSANNSETPMVVSTIRDLYDRAEEGYFCVPETYFYCETCNTNWAEGNVRYRVVVRVLDKTSDAPFILWDKDYFELLGITAYDLKTKYSMAKIHVPAEFDQLRNKSMVFRLNLKNDHIRNPAKPISVLNVMHDEELEVQYCPSMVDDHDELSRMESESSDEAKSSSMQPDLKLKGMDKPQDEVDTGAIKRCLLDQFSSSQNLKKSRPVVIKQEKN